ncbi:hypothetical protein KIN20_005144 [Parelaphostrongylus tenuis]|uniref:Uncharacterized protein n=1 Tax=Parelaphostrongylus tenuis TaxID=148309 RepID=A0AAD5QH93_PARTN|nr:hypothetical protein KIN20_005144 [Parelaphostrongylus tenuis]
MSFVWFGFVKDIYPNVLSSQPSPRPFTNLRTTFLEASDNPVIWLLVSLVADEDVRTSVCVRLSLNNLFFHNSAGHSPS